VIEHFKAGDKLIGEDSRDYVVVEVIGAEHDGRLATIPIATGPGENGAVPRDAWWKE
jgi:hypothetical protein